MCQRDAQVVVCMEQLQVLFQRSEGPVSRVLILAMDQANGCEAIARSGIRGVLFGRPAEGVLSIVQPAQP